MVVVMDRRNKITFSRSFDRQRDVQITQIFKARSCAASLNPDDGNCLSYVFAILYVVFGQDLVLVLQMLMAWSIA